MRDVDPETQLEQRLRASLREEGDRAGPPVSVQRLQALAHERRRRRSQFRTAAAAAALIVVVAGAATLVSLRDIPGVGSESPVPSSAGPSHATPLPSTVAADFPLDVDLRCADPLDGAALAFPSGVFRRVPDDLRATPGGVALLNALPGNFLNGILLPRSGWILAARTPTTELYLAPAGPDAPDAWSQVAVVQARSTGDWIANTAGTCRPELAVGTARGAEWVLDPAAPAPGRDTTTLSLLVTERVCASGRPPDGRHLAPVIREGDGWLGIGWAIEPLPGGQDCQGNPAAAVTVQLQQPLGDRVLLDLGTFPFAERS